MGAEMVVEVVVCVLHLLPVHRVFWIHDLLFTWHTYPLHTPDVYLVQLPSAPIASTPAFIIERFFTASQYGFIMGCWTITPRIFPDLKRLGLRQICNEQSPTAWLSFVSSPSTAMICWKQDIPRKTALSSKRAMWHIYPDPHHSQVPQRQAQGENSRSTEQQDSYCLQVLAPWLRGGDNTGQYCCLRLAQLFK